MKEITKSFILILLMISFAGINKSFSQGEIPDGSEDLRENAVRIFIDCESCDMNYIREQIPYANFVRDTREAQVYVLETRQSTGSGGREYTYFFEGQEDFVNMNDTLKYSTNPDDTSNTTREGRTNMLKMGLMRYVAKTPLYNEVQITSVTGSQRPEVEAIDKWNNWVFEIEARPMINLEESVKMSSMSNSFNVTKITPDIKIELQLDQSSRKTKYIFGPDTITVKTNSISFDNLIVKSMGEHWSVGGRVNFARSTYSNYNAQLDIFPSIEYNLYPYSESTHRQLRVLYGIGVSLNDYTEETIYDKMKENLFKHQLQIAYQVQEKWGSVNVSLEGSNYFHDFQKNRLEMSGSLRIRITKGLTFNVNGSAARIRDQLNLVKGGASSEDVYLRLQELATAYDIMGSVGLSYTFGSIYNNVVNPRFGNGGSSYGSGGGGFSGGGGGFSGGGGRPF